MIARMRNVLIGVAAAVAVLGFVNFFAKVIPVYVSHPLAFVAVVFVLVQLMRSAIARPADPPPPLTGPPLASARCSGRIGRVDLRNMIRATAYADRLDVQITLVGARTIMADQIVSVAENKSFRHGWPGVRITHDAAGLASPVTLALRDGHPLRHAVRSFTVGRPAPVTSPPVAEPQNALSRLVSIGAMVGAVLFLGIGVVMLVNGITFGVAMIFMALVSLFQVLRNR